MRAALRALLGTIAVAVAASAAAHHSFFGRFDTLTITELEGEVTAVSWRNPHAYFTVRADGDPGTLVGVLGEFHGRVRQTSYDDDVEQAIDDSMR